jgi:ribonuclease HIII
MNSGTLIYNELDKLVELIKNRLLKEEIEIETLEKIDYGYKIFFNKSTLKARVNIYFSPKKKKYSVVPQKGGDDYLLKFITNIINSFIKDRTSNLNGLKGPSYSHIHEINDLIDHSISDFIQSGFKIIDHKENNYGTNFEFLHDNIQSIFSIYYTIKNGFKVTFPVDLDNSLKDKIKEVLFKNYKVEDKLDIPFEKYAGMDEAGKGDYFGPLVIAGFRFDKSIEKDLLKLGVADSKSLANEKLKSIAEELSLRYPERVKILEILPVDYNLKYDELKKEGGNLNTMLASFYRDLIKKIKDLDKNEGIIIDKFAREDFILKIILRDMPDMKILLIEKAERNLAVAAASILARSIFIRNIEKISAKYNFNIPLGAGENVFTAAKEFFKKYGEENLYSICKKHFKLTQNVIGTLF